MQSRLVKELKYRTDQDTTEQKEQWRDRERGGTPTAGLKGKIEKDLDK